jgi:hypothetical protein
MGATERLPNVKRPMIGDRDDRSTANTSAYSTVDPRKGVSPVFIAEADVEGH